MANVTSLFYFNLTMFEDHGLYRYLYFLLSLVVYIAIIFLNVIILFVISQQRTLHQPMYFLIACLLINSLYGSAGFFPRLLMDLLSDTHLISRPACFTQIYVIYSYASYEFNILTIMAYDRYIAICKPLHYHTMTSKIYYLIAFSWIYPVFTIGCMCIRYLYVNLQLCGNTIERVFCSNWAVIRLSCVDTTKNSIMGLFLMVTTVFISLGLVLYSYIRIILVCQKSSTEFRSKAFQTCLPHIVTLVIYSITTFCDIALSRYEPNEVYPWVALILSLEFVVIPPILNPLVYGLYLPEIRKHILKLLSPSKMPF